jgi:dihydroorotate dehydrogenase
MLREIIDRRRLPLGIVGVGGICSATDVVARLEAGAHHVQLATAAMLDPMVAVNIRRELGAGGTVKTSERAKNLQPA